MMMSSIFGIPVSAKTAMCAYRLMLHRVTVVANNFDDFINLPNSVQETLLRYNADMIVSLRAAQFFQMKRQGKDQILSSIGMGDCATIQTLIAETEKIHNTHEKDYKAIEYRKFNTIQKYLENEEDEERYDLLLSRVGVNVAFDEKALILISYVVLFSSDYTEEAISIEDQNTIKEAQQRLILILQRYIYSSYPEDTAIILFKNLLKCLDDVKELCFIKKQRRIVATRKVAFSDSSFGLSPAPSTDAYE